MNWYIVHTKPGCESSLAASLGKKGLEYFLPEFLFADPGKRRKPGAKKCLIEGHLFVRTRAEDLPTVLKIRGVAGLLFWLDSPAFIHDEEIKLIRLFLAEFAQLKIEKSAVARQAMARIATLALPDESNMPMAGRKLIKLVLPSLGYTLTTEVVTAARVTGVQLSKTM